MSTASTNPEVYFHVGLGKAASTYLQYAFFPKLKGVHYIQRTRYRRSPGIIRQGGHDKYFVSREFDQQLESEVKWFSSEFPDARPVIIFRRHDGWIASQYRRYVKNGGYLPFTGFFNVEDDSGLWKREDVYYLPKIDILRKYFHHEPLVIFYEDLRKDPYGFFDQIAGFMGAGYDREAISLKTIHSSYSEKQLKAMRRVSRRLFVQQPQFSHNKIWHWIQRRSRLLACYVILYGSLLLPDSLFSKEALIEPEELDKVRRFFDEEWKNLTATYSPRQVP